MYLWCSVDPKAHVQVYKQETKNEEKPGSHQSREKVKVLTLTPPNNRLKANIAVWLERLLPSQASRKTSIVNALGEWQQKKGRKLLLAWTYLRWAQTKSEQLFNFEAP